MCIEVMYTIGLWDYTLTLEAAQPSAGQMRPAFAPSKLPRVLNPRVAYLIPEIFIASLGRSRSPSSGQGLVNKDCKFVIPLIVALFRPSVWLALALWYEKHINKRSPSRSIQYQFRSLYSYIVRCRCAQFRCAKFQAQIVHIAAMPGPCLNLAPFLEVQGSPI